MEALNDAGIMNNLVGAERLAGDECRVCLKSCTDACQHFRNDHEIPEKLMAIAAVQIEEGDGLPAAICLPCNHLLEVAYNFRCQIQSSDAKLRGILKMEMPAVLRDQYAKDATMVKDITDVISNVVSCGVDDSRVVGEQEIYDATAISSHDIVTFDGSDVVSSDGVAIDDGSRLSHEFMRTKAEEGEKDAQDAPYDALKESVHNVEMMEVALRCHETDAAGMHADALADHSSRLSDECPPTTVEDRCVKQERVASLSDGRNESLESLTDESKGEVDALKREIKRDVSSLVEGLDDAPRVVTKRIASSSRSTKNGANCSDDEEKPLISRTASRDWCLHCMKSFTTKLAFQRHMAVHKTKLRYVCHICDKQFSNVAKLKSHVRNHDVRDKAKAGRASRGKSGQDSVARATGKASAKITRNCASAAQLADDAREEKRNFKFTCKFCPKQFIYQKSFISHAKSHPEYSEETTVDADADAADESAYKMHDAEEEEQQQQQRNKATPTFRENESEEEEEEEEEEDDDDSELPIESLQCTQCGKLFATKRNLKRHISTHSGLKFNCSTCGKGFSRIDKLKDHEQSKHRKEDMFDNVNDEDDDDEDNENSESRKKGRQNRPHKCVLCPKAFAQAQSLANHMERHKRVKDTQKRYLCEVCSKRFAQSGSLVAHMRTHTGVKPYVCNVCSRAFTKSTYLQLHLRTHSGEKPYICQYCSRAFARANTLARHITMHTGEAKYQCQICTKSFRRLTSLNEHTYTHTGQRPYACKLCTKRYNNAGSLYAHTKKCKAQQLSNATSAYAVSADSVPLQNDSTVPQLLIYSQRKLVEEVTVGQVVPTPQYMVANVHNQKTVSANVIQPFTVDDPSVYNTKQFKNSYFYPNM